MGLGARDPVLSVHFTVKGFVFTSGLRVLAFASYGWYEQVAQKHEEKKSVKSTHCIPPFSDQTDGEVQSKGTLGDYAREATTRVQRSKITDRSHARKP